MIENKDDFFNHCPLKTACFNIGDSKVELHELTLAQRSELLDIIDKDSVRAQAHIVMMGCDLFDETDLEKLMSRGAVIKDMADKIYQLSGLAGDSLQAAEKNLESDSSTGSNSD